MSGTWSTCWQRLSKIYQMEFARAIHFPLMAYFVCFILVHIVLVMTTGAVSNLNHMSAARDDNGWLGFSFLDSLLAIMIVAWLSARPRVLRPIAQPTDKAVR